MPPKKDICVALKKFLSARTVNVPDKQFLLLLRTTFYNMHIYEHANHRDVNYHVYIYIMYRSILEYVVY